MPFAESVSFYVAAAGSLVLVRIAAGDLCFSSSIAIEERVCWGVEVRYIEGARFKIRRRDAVNFEDQQSWPWFRSEVRR